MKKTFYGKSDFAYIRKQNGYYIDKIRILINSTTCSGIIQPVFCLKQ